MSAILTNTIIGNPFIKLNSVDSTNNYAMRQAKSGLAKHGTAYFAYEQTAGKGQRNKQWLSAKNENIILSVVLNTQKLLLSQQFYLNIVSALAAINLFNNYTTNNLKIKWPNDIYWQDRKAGGILIENSINSSTWNFAAVGFGLNINQTTFNPSLKNPCSLKQITGNEYSVIDLSRELCTILEIKFHQLLANKINVLMDEYNQHLYKKNSLVKFRKNSVVFEGKVVKVDEAGRLIVKTSHEEAFEFGSLEWIIE